jgi:hypothetical protein
MSKGERRVSRIADISPRPPVLRLRISSPDPTPAAVPHAPKEDRVVPTTKPFPTDITPAEVVVFDDQPGIVLASLNGEVFSSLCEAQIRIEKLRRHDNTVRPHSALGYRPSSGNHRPNGPDAGQALTFKQDCSMGAVQEFRPNGY